MENPNLNNKSPVKKISTETGITRQSLTRSSVQLNNPRTRLLENSAADLSKEIFNYLCTLNGKKN